MVSARRPAPYAVGDQVTGTSYVPPEDRRRAAPEPITGRVVQVGSGWDGVDAARAFVWVRLPSGQERQALIRDITKVTP
ncbi:hypothetical protein ACFXKW_10960 [Streptomyces sp. NPDC059193]